MNNSLAQLSTKRSFFIYDAIEQENIELLENLIKNGASVNQSDSRYSVTPLYLAVTKKILKL